MLCSSLRPSEGPLESQNYIQNELMCFLIICCIFFVEYSSALSVIIIPLLSNFDAFSCLSTLGTSGCISLWRQMCEFSGMLQGCSWSERASTALTNVLLGVAR